jgi:uncharacterized protein (TIGR02145 family)
MKKTTMTMMLLVTTLICAAQPGSFSNVTATQRTDGSALVDINFDLSGPALTYYISLEVSFNNGANYWPISASAISGDLQIDQGTGYHIVWDAVQSHPNRFSDQSKIMLVANAASTLNPCPVTPTVTDFDGNVYNTVLIGTQCWMKENLRTTRFRDGFSVQPGHKWYGNDISYKYQYGGLYHWHAVNSEHGLCPEGWHVPTQAEWDVLVNYVFEGSSNLLKSCRQVGSPVGDDCNTEEHPRWNQHASVYGIDEHGFSALPGGYFSGSVLIFQSLGDYGYWWTSEPYYTRSMKSSTYTVTTSSSHTNQYNSVRCIKTVE